VSFPDPGFENDPDNNKGFSVFDDAFYGVLFSGKLYVIKKVVN
jgi:hypothetical protein